jgi:sugar phosphate isomerase/epimerase
MSFDMNRRQFLAGAAAIGTAAATFSRVAAAGKTGPQVCAFSKHLQFLDYEALAKTCREIGLDGVDLTVREKGHVLPENVARDLPAAVEAVRAEGLDVPMITTRLTNATEPTARPILEAAAKLGIKYFRIGGHLYDARGDIPPQIAKFTEEVRGLAGLGRELGMIAGYHNHSGALNFGAPVWDLYQMFETIASPHAGSNFDTGHATVEGGFGDWQITARLMAPHTKMMAVKDFVWEKDKPRWVPLGQGVVKTAECLEIMCRAGFQGPISMHFEYAVPSNDAMIEEVRSTAVTVRGYLKKAGYA